MHDWQGDDLLSRGLFLDMKTWQACIFSIAEETQDICDVSPHIRIDSYSLLPGRPGRRAGDEGLGVNVEPLPPQQRSLQRTKTGCDGATVSIQYGRLNIEFSRSAASLAKAIIIAIHDVRKVSSV